MQDCSTDQDQLRTQGNFGKKKIKIFWEIQENKLKWENGTGYGTTVQAAVPQEWIPRLSSLTGWRWVNTIMLLWKMQALYSSVCIAAWPAQHMK